MKGIIFLAACGIAISLVLFAHVHHGGLASTEIKPGESAIVAQAQDAPPKPLRHTRTSLHPPGAESAASTNLSTNLYTRLSQQGDVKHVRREQLEAYLARHHHSVDALLGALRASGDDALLKEAKERFPDDPRVQFAAAYKTDSAEERQQWLEKFKASEPANSLANYLLAGEHLEAGRIESALQELAAAGGKAGFDNHLREFVQDAEEAYHAAGFSEAEAKGTACWSALLPELIKLKQVSLGLVDLAKRYEQAGDSASALAVRQMGTNLGRRLDQSPQPTMIQELVGSAIERIILNSMNPDTPYGNAGQTVKGLTDAIAERRKSLHTLNEQAEPMLRTMPDAELAHFYDRLKMYGEVAALRWVVNQTPTP